MATCTHRVATPSTSNTGTYASGSFTPAANDLLVVFVVSSGNTGGSLSSSVGLSFTQVAAVAKNASADRVYVFVADALASAVAQTVTFATSGGNATGCIIEVCSVLGMVRTGASAVRQSATNPNVASGSAPSATFAQAALTGNPTLGVAGNGTNPATLTAPTNWTEANDTGYNTPPTGCEYVFRNSGFTGTAITWASNSASAYGVATIELDTSLPPVSATGAATLDAVVGSGQTQELVQASGAGTLEAVAGSGTSQLLAQAQASRTLDAVLGSGSAQVQDTGVSAAGAALLDWVLGSAAAEALVAGSGAATLDPLLGAGAVRVDVSAAGATSLEDIAGSGSAGVDLQGASATLLDSVLGAGAAGAPVFGAGEQPLDSVLGSGAALLLAQGSGSALLDDIVAAGTGVVGSQPVTGEAATVLDDVAGAGDTAVAGAGTGSWLLADVLSSSAAVALLQSQVAAVLDDVLGWGSAQLGMASGYVPPVARFHGTGSILSRLVGQASIQAGTTAGGSIEASKSAAGSIVERIDK